MAGTLLGIGLAVAHLAALIDALRIRVRYYPLRLTLQPEQAFHHGVPRVRVTLGGRADSPTRAPITPTVQLSWRFDRRTVQFRARLMLGAATWLSAAEAKRGHYLPVAGAATHYDALHLWTIRQDLAPPTHANAPLLVLPRRRELHDRMRVEALGLPEDAGAGSQRRSEELIETRPYLPGDDPHHINWKVYAHTGQLFVRRGEQLPPPQGSLQLTLDNRQGDWPYDLLDDLCELSLALFAAATASGLQVQLRGIDGTLLGASDDLGAARSAKLDRLSENLAALTLCSPLIAPPTGGAEGNRLLTVLGVRQGDHWVPAVRDAQGRILP